MATANVSAAIMFFRPSTCTCTCSGFGSVRGTRYKVQGTRAVLLMERKYVRKVTRLFVPVLLYAWYCFLFFFSEVQDQMFRLRHRTDWE